MSEDYKYGHNASYAGEGGGVDDFLASRTRGAFDSNVLNEKHIKDAGEDGLTVILVAKEDGEKYRLRWCYDWVKRIQAKARDGSDSKEWRVWLDRLNSYDGSSVHLEQKKRRNGERKVPPTDPFGKFSEEVYRAVYDGEIDWLEPVVEFKSDKLDETRLFRAGAFYGAFDEYNLTDAQCKEMAGAHIVKKEAYKHVVVARPRYSFCVVHKGEPKILDVRGDTIGEKVKAALQGAKKDYGEKGNPFVNPYPIRIIHHKNRSGSDKNEVRVMIAADLSAEEREAIGGSVADDADLLALYDVDKLRAQLEEHACSRKLVLPWLDRSFPASSSASKASSSPANNAAGETYQCPHCSKPTLRDGVNVCSACGMEVDDDFAFVSRPCVECGTQVKVGAEGEEVSCPKCGAVHRQDPSSDLEDDVPAWTLVRKGEPKVEEPADFPAPKAARARRRAAGSAQ